MHCIRCKTNMKKKNLRGVLVDYCTICDAFWLDAGELEALEKGMTKSTKELEQECRMEAYMERARPLTIMESCPKCQESQVMEKRMDGVTLDYCKACHGLFFDHGELDEILQNRDQGFFARLMTNLFGA